MFTKQREEEQNFHFSRDPRKGKQAEYKGQESFATEEAPEDISGNMSEHSVRMRRICGHPSGSFDYVNAEEVNHNRKKDKAYYVDLFGFKQLPESFADNLYNMILGGDL